MPELPEVETVKETLKKQIIGEKIINVDVYYEQMIDEELRSEFKKLLINETLMDILRYGKYLLFIFEHVSLISHLRMEGKYFIKNKNEYRNIHEHIIFTFASGKTLRYHDTRKFGTMKLVKTTSFKDIMEEPELKKLGPEANSEDIDIDVFYNQLHSKKIKLKTALLDQTILAGLGNIYVDEVCFLTGLHPEYECSKLTKFQCKEIIKNAKYVLTGAIKAGGTTIRSYTSSLGVTGRFQLKLHVHTKEGYNCENCNTVIKKIQVGGRGTYYCEYCQKKSLPLIVGITGGPCPQLADVSVGSDFRCGQCILHALRFDCDGHRYLRTAYHDVCLVVPGPYEAGAFQNLFHGLFKAHTLSGHLHFSGKFFLDVGIIYEMDLEPFSEVFKNTLYPLVFLGICLHGKCQEKGKDSCFYNSCQVHFFSLFRI